jgi:two-component sensor histidine kinase
MGVLIKIKPGETAISLNRGHRAFGAGAEPGMMTSGSIGGQTSASGTANARARGPCNDCRLLEEADHRIANHLALLAGFVRIKAADLARRPDQPDPVDTLILLESICTQIDAIAHQHRAMARIGRTESEDLGERLRDLCTPMAPLLIGRMNLVEDLAPRVRVDCAQILPLTQIVAEAVTNAVKHAARPDRMGTITVRCRQDVTGSIMIEVSDDGPGLSAAPDSPGDRLGFRLLRALAKSLGAHLTFDSTDKGLCVRVVLPRATLPD